MNVCWCTLSGGGGSGGRVTVILSVATHDSCLGCAGLMAGLARRACGAVMSNLYLVSVCPAVPDLVPNRFGVAPVGGANMDFCHWGVSVGAGDIRSSTLSLTTLILRQIISKYII
jgi:hypothetical protein